MARRMFHDLGTPRTVTGLFCKGKHQGAYYIELTVGGLRWDVDPKPAHLAHLGARVCATGERVAFKRLRLSAMRPVE